MEDRMKVPIEDWMKVQTKDRMKVRIEDWIKV
jgi:hypothetical protein